MAKMIEQCDRSAVEGELPIKDLSDSIGQAVLGGDTTGDPLVDLVIVRAGVYLPEVAQRYRPISEKLRQYAGQCALVIVREAHYTKRHDMHYRYVCDSSNVSLMKGTLSGEAPDIDAKTLTWAIPTVGGYSKQTVNGNGKLFATKYSSQFSKPIRMTGNMPVDDMIKNPDEKGQESTLDKEGSSTGIATSNDPESAYSSRFRTRYSRRVSLIFGQEMAVRLIEKHREAYPEDSRESHAERERFPKLLMDLASINT